jgi:hypothetical protein
VQTNTGTGTRRVIFFEEVVDAESGLTGLLQPLPGGAADRGRPRHDPGATWPFVAPAEAVAEGGRARLGFGAVLCDLRSAAPLPMDPYRYWAPECSGSLRVSGGSVLQSTGLFRACGAEADEVWALFDTDGWAHDKRPQRVEVYRVQSTTAAEQFVVTRRSLWGQLLDNVRGRSLRRCSRPPPALPRPSRY